MIIHEWYLGLFKNGKITKEVCLLRMQEQKTNLELQLKEVERIIEEVLSE